MTDNASQSLPGSPRPVQKIRFGTDIDVVGTQQNVVHAELKLVSKVEVRNEDGSRRIHKHEERGMTLVLKPLTYTTPHQPYLASGATLALIPAHNEERFIGSLVLAVRSYVDEVIVVDDGSADRTAEIARQAGATVLQHRRNSGKAAAVNTGFAYARKLAPAALVMLDGDGQHCADDIPQVLEPVTSGRADVVVGSRFLHVKSDIPAYRQVGQHGLTFVTNLASGVRVSDSQSGFRAFSGRAVQNLSFSQGGFSIESEMQFLVKEHHLRVVEAPIKVIYAEKAKRNPVKHGLQVLNGVLRLMGQLRPLLFFGMSGLVLALIGGVLGLHLTQIYTTTHELAIGYGLLTVLLCVIGMVLFFAGVILHSTRAMLRDMRRSLVDRYIAEPAVSVNVLRPQRTLVGAREPRLEVTPVLLERSVGA